LSFSLLSHHPPLLPFPTRRSSDLAHQAHHLGPLQAAFGQAGQVRRNASAGCLGQRLLPEWFFHGAKRIVMAAAPHHLEVRLGQRSEEHTSELQSRENLVCRLLLEK